MSVVGTKPKIIGCVDTKSAPIRTNTGIVDTAAMVLPDALTIPAPALTSVTSTVEKSAMTQPPQQPPTQVFAQQRRSGCGTLLVALLVLAIITAIVIFLGAFGLLGWIFS
jgi:nitrate reductase NapE component